MKYQSSGTHCSKVISKVKVSERRTELQNDRQDKNNMPPDLRSRGHKNIELKIETNERFFLLLFLVYCRGNLEDAVTDTTGIPIRTHATVRIYVFCFTSHIKNIQPS